MEKINFNRFSFSSLKYVKHVLPQVCEVFSEKVLTEKHEMEALFLKKIFQTCTQLAFTCTKLTIETLEQGLKYAQS